MAVQLVHARRRIVAELDPRDEDVRLDCDVRQIVNFPDVAPQLEGIRALSMNDERGVRASDLEFLRYFPNVERLHVLGLQLPDSRGIRFLSRLRELALDVRDNTPLDFGQHPDLRAVRLYWRKGSDSLFALPALEELTVHGYRADDLRQVGACRRLRELYLLGGTIQSLRGLESCAELETLECYNLKRLVDARALRALRHLTKLTLDGCSKIGRLDDCASLRSLRWISFNGCGRIESLAPLAGLPKLEVARFYEDTIVVDGQASGLARVRSLKKFSFQNRRHYDMTRRQVAEALGLSLFDHDRA